MEGHELVFTDQSEGVNITVPLYVWSCVDGHELMVVFMVFKFICWVDEQSTHVIYSLLFVLWSLVSQSSTGRWDWFTGILTYNIFFNIE